MCVFTAVYFGAEYGWYDLNSSEDINELEIPVGTGILSTTAGSDVKVTSAGEVSGADIVVPVATGYTFLGSCVPADITLGQIVPNENFDTEGNDTIQFFSTGWNQGSVLTAVYFGSEYGWYDLNTSEAINSAVVSAGTGFLVTTANSGVTFTFPGL